MAVTGTCLPVRFMDNNVACAQSTTITASSEAAGSPVTNIKNKARTKFWKAAGNFEIDSTNDTIYIDDGGPLVGTIPSGQYTGTTLAAAIQTELNTISSGWTVTYNTTTYRFFITHATATLEFSKQTDAIWDTIGYTGTVDVVLSGAALESDELRIHSCEYVDFDLGVSTYEILFGGFLSDVGNALCLSRSATVRLLADNVPITTTSTPAQDVTLTFDDRGFLVFLDDLTDNFYRFWRLKIEDRTNGDGPGAIKLSFAYLGDYLTFTSTNIARGFRKSYVDPSTSQTSQSGRRYFNKRNPYQEFQNLQIQLPIRAERLAFEQFVHDHGIVEPFFISIDPGNKISTDLSELTLFGNFAALPDFDHQFLDLYNITSFTVREVV